MQCNVCLNSNYESIKSINECDEGNVQWSFKLQEISPEVEWIDCYVICDVCSEQLDIAYNFKLLCTTLDSQRQSLIEKNDTLCLYELKRDSGEQSPKKECDSVPDETSPMKSDETIVIKPEQTSEKERFICYHCEKPFRRKISLKHHIKKYHSNQDKIKKSQTCLKCEKSYKTARLFKSHVERCDGIRRHKKTSQTRYQCNHCHRYYTTEKILKAHYKSCTQAIMNVYYAEDPDADKWKPIKRLGRQSDRSFYCEICRVEFAYIKVLIEHCVTFHSMEAKAVKPYSCEDCPMRFSSSANVIQHRKYHEGERSLVCSICGKRFITKGDLTSHELTHYNRRNYKCDVCEKAFNTNNNLRTHKLVVHTDSTEWKYSCEVCSKRFPMKTGYSQHMRRHTGDKQFPCYICNKSFVSNGELKKHVKFHSNIKPFKCEYCAKEYRGRKVYEVHLAKVHNIGDAKMPARVKKFVCHICPTRFYDRQKLDRHLCTHSGLKPFECTSCDKKFTDKSYLRYHLKVAHQIIEEDPE